MAMSREDMSYQLDMASVYASDADNLVGEGKDNEAQEKIQAAMALLQKVLEVLETNEVS